MFTRRYVKSTLLIATLCASTAALPEAPDEVRDRILTQTKLIAVTELPVPAAEYKGDGDPMTMEIVFLTDKADGPSRVTDDGEVIFLYKASEKTQQKLIEQAFEIRIASALGEI